MDFGKWNFLALVLKHFLYFFRFQETVSHPKKLFIFQETEALKGFLYFRKLNFFVAKKKLNKTFLKLLAPKILIKLS